MRSVPSYTFTIVTCMMLIGIVTPISDGELAKIRTGVSFAEKMSKVMKAKQFETFLGSAGSLALNFISGTLTFVDAILLFLGNNESQELLAIKQMYNEVNRRFDLVDQEFKNIQNLINWSTLKTQYSRYENNIVTASTLFKEIYEAPIALKTSKKDYFMHSFESCCMTSNLNLFNGIMDQNSQFSDDILKVVMTTLKYDRPKTQVFMLGLFKLLVLGINNELAYKQFKYGDVVRFEKEVWKSRLLNVTLKMSKINQAIISKYHNQADQDIAELSEKYLPEHLPNKNFSELLYYTLVKKYDWRDWLVVVYKPIWGVQKHINHICQGWRRYGMFGRDVLVTSVDESRKPINTTIANVIISSIQTTSRDCQKVIADCTGNSNNCPYGVENEYRCHTSRKNAEQVFRSLPQDTYKCDNYESVGVIDSWVDLWYQGKPERLVHQITPGVNSYSIHLFG